MCSGAIIRARHRDVMRGHRWEMNSEMVAKPKGMWHSMPPMRNGDNCAGRKRVTSYFGIRPREGEPINR